MTKSERAPAIFFLLLSIFVCQQSAGVGIGTLSQPGPGLLSFGAGAGFGLLALWFLIQSFLRNEPSTKTTASAGKVRRGRFLLVCFSLFAYTFAAKWLGFIVSTFLFSIFIFFMIESKKWWRILLVAALISVGNYFFFEKWLDVTLPKGFFGW